MFNLKFILMAWAVLFSPGIVVAAQGVEDTQIRLAQVAALDGPAAAFGQGMRLGMVAAFEDAGKNLTRTRFMAALRNLGSIDFGAVTMQFGPDDNQGMDDVFLTRITQDGGFVSVE
ncbi:hypothetical protein [Sediminimonas qiaohouensis]|uniref:hypothetical protein n=1 Tax=Sediminimonas qiaohouensis TaxID=552061 RepID=UPI000428FC00|nr:hypothetical protein [Sediminimonas qiaohouensis]